MSSTTSNTADVASRPVPAMSNVTEEMAMKLANQTLSGWLTQGAVLGTIYGGVVPSDDFRIGLGTKEERKLVADLIGRATTRSNCESREGHKSEDLDDAQSKLDEAYAALTAYQQEHSAEQS